MHLIVHKSFFQRPFSTIPVPWSTCTGTSVRDRRATLATSCIRTWAAALAMMRLNWPLLFFESTLAVKRLWQPNHALSYLPKQYIRILNEILVTASTDRTITVYGTLFACSKPNADIKIVTTRSWPGASKGSRELPSKSRSSRTCLFSICCRGLIFHRQWNFRVLAFLPGR